MVNIKKLRIVKCTMGRSTYYVIQLKGLFRWSRFNGYEYAALDDALRVVNYYAHTKEQVWP
jgi:hypothetical protein